MWSQEARRRTQRAEVIGRVGRIPTLRLQHGYWREVQPGVREAIDSGVLRGWGAAGGVPDRVAEVTAEMEDARVRGRCSSVKAVTEGCKEAATWTTSDGGSGWRTVRWR